MCTELEDIKQKVKKWTADNIDPDFDFRPGQFEAISGIVYHIIHHNLDTNILQAPTGTGKSFICIISAGVLADYYDIKSYILASDLFLWQQYADAIDKYHLKNFGYVKGSLGNYYCDYRHCSYEEGECKQHRISLQKFRSKDSKTVNKWPCYKTCQYMLDRFRAEKTPVTLLTYQLWLHQVNLVKNTDPEQGFTARRVIFCDECHNIPDIVSKFAQPQIAPKDREKLTIIAEYLDKHNIETPWVPSFFKSDIQKQIRKLDENSFRNKRLDRKILDITKVMLSFDYIVSSLNVALSGKPVNTRFPIKTEILQELLSYLHNMDKIANAVDEYVKDNTKISSKKPVTDQEFRHTIRKGDLPINPETGEQMTIEEYKNFYKQELSSEMSNTDTAIHSILSWYHNYTSSFKLYAKAIELTGDQYIVVEKTLDSFNNNLPIFTFYCVKEDYLCSQYLLNNAQNKVLTSATVGNITSFMQNIGIDMTRILYPNYVMYTPMPNIFDFSQSPIYYLPNYKMNYNEKKTSFPILQDIIYKICSMYPDAHGMINTGSYANSTEILENAKPDLRKRLVTYDSAKSKKMNIDKFKAKNNTILMGPSLVEGVDLPGDLCRFIIIVKLPYPNISSPMTKAKTNLFPLWYTSTTSNTMIQNIGRGVRFQGDWCHTYIIDGCFDNLYQQTYSQYSPEIQNRFIRITPEMINENYQKFKLNLDK